MNLNVVPRVVNRATSKFSGYTKLQGVRATFEVSIFPARKILFAGLQVQCVLQQHSGICNEERIAIYTRDAQQSSILELLNKVSFIAKKGI